MIYQYRLIHMNISLTLDLRGTDIERIAELEKEQLLIGSTGNENFDISDKGKNAIST